MEYINKYLIKGGHLNCFRDKNRNTYAKKNESQAVEIHIKMQQVGIDRKSIKIIFTRRCIIHKQ